jgi:hypothetical protein
MGSESWQVAAIHAGAYVLFIVVMIGVACWLQRYEVRP